MEELDMIKAFAELDGLHFNDRLVGENGSIWASFMDGGCYGWYSPITDYALAFKAMVDYGVDVQHCTNFDCSAASSGGFDITYICVSIQDLKGSHAVTPMGELSMESTAKAIIECILKSKGLWK